MKSLSTCKVGGALIAAVFTATLLLLSSAGHYGGGGVDATVDWAFDERRLVGAARWGYLKENPSFLAIDDSPGSSSPLLYPLCNNLRSSGSSSSGNNNDGIERATAATQSPINIQMSAINPHLPRLEPDWIDAHNFTISNDGVEVLFTPRDVIPSFRWPGTSDTYELLYFRFVVPGGHEFGSGPRAGEIQLVHRKEGSSSHSGTGTREAGSSAASEAATAAGTTTSTPDDFAIVIITLDAGYGPHEYLSTLLQLIPTAPADALVPLTEQQKWNQSYSRPASTLVFDRTELSVQRLFPSTSSYVTYTGSLPTPPCTEGVRYLVFAEPIKVSFEQIDVFKSKILRDIPRQTRPAQPLNSRAHPQLHHFRRPYFSYEEPEDVHPLGFTGTSVAVGLAFSSLGTLVSLTALIISIVVTRREIN